MKMITAVVILVLAFPVLCADGQSNPNSHYEDAETAKQLYDAAEKAQKARDDFFDEIRHRYASHAVTLATSGYITLLQLEWDLSQIHVDPTSTGLRNKRKHRTATSRTKVGRKASSSAKISSSSFRSRHHHRTTQYSPVRESSPFLLISMQHLAWKRLRHR